MYLERGAFIFSSLNYWKQLLTSSVANLWHPLTVFSHDILLDISQKAPWVHHVVNCALHLLNSVLIFLWLRLLKAEVWIALFVALLWVFHPTLVESTSWVSGRKDLLGLFFTLGALICALSSRKWGVVGFGLLAMLSKPTAIMLPGLLIIQDMSVQRGSFRRWRSLGGRVLTHLPIIMCALCVMILTLYFQSQGGQAIYDDRSILERLTGASWALLHSIRLWFWPSGLHVSYSDPQHLSFLYLLCGGLAAAGFLAVLISGRTPPLIRIGLALFLLFLLPTLGFIRAGNSLIADRYLYFSGVGLTLVFVYSLSFARWLYLGGSLIIVLLFSHLSWQQRQHWRTTESLFQRVLDLNPNHSDALAHLGTLSKQEENHAEAKEYFRQALISNSQNPIAHLHLAGYALEQKKYREAYEHYSVAAKLRKDDWLYEIMAKLAWNLGKKVEAREHLNNAYSAVKSSEMRAKLDTLKSDFSKGQ